MQPSQTAASASLQPNVAPRDPFALCFVFNHVIILQTFPNAFKLTNLTRIEKAGNELIN